jgi:hypothetical protein
LIPVLSQMNPVHILQQYFFKIHFNIVHLHLALPSGLFLSFLCAFLIAYMREI